MKWSLIVSIGGTRALLTLEIARGQHRCTWRRVKDAPDVFIYCWVMEPLCVLQRVGIGNDLPYIGIAFCIRAIVSLLMICTLQLPG